MLVIGFDKAWSQCSNALSDFSSFPLDYTPITNKIETYVTRMRLFDKKGDIMGDPKLGNSGNSFDNSKCATFTRLRPFRVYKIANITT